MGRIHLTLSGNSFHSNVTPERWRQMFKEKAGIEAIVASEVPVSMSYQRIDFEIMPWLKETLESKDSYSCVELLRAPYSHSLLPLMHPRQGEWEMRRGYATFNVFCWFFPEFYVPEGELFHRYAFSFFVLGSNSVVYSEGEHPGAMVLRNNITKHNAIGYAGKIGLVMREPNFLKEFFTFQRELSEQSLETLLKAIEKIAMETPEDYVCITPIDIEAPYVGSWGGALVWERFFNGIKQSGLSKHFISVREAERMLEPQAVKIGRPHRELGQKWLKYEAQFRHMAWLANYVPDTEREHKILALAATSDVLSGLETKISQLKGPRILQAKDSNGNAKEITIGFNQDVIDACMAARFALVDKQPLIRKIQKTCDCSSLQIQSILSWAEQNNL